MSLDTFESMNLDPQIYKAITACGYTKPTPVQARCIPEILNGKDVVASAQTGTGKTAAFVLPSLHKLCSTTSSSKPRVLILTPTRELASQITGAASKYGKFLRFNIISLVGGMSYRQQLRDLSRNVDIVVATPGRLLDHMQNRRIDLSSIEMLILDEADRMLDMGFIDDVKDIAKVTPATRQTLLFSATVDDKLSGVVRQLLKNPVRIDFSHEKMSPTQIKQQVYLVDNVGHKNRLLQHFLVNENIFKGIIFSATKMNADRLAGELIDQGFAAAPLHGDLKQNVRNRTVEQLRRGKIQFLVATDVAARGIDISDLTHVINFDIPKFCEDYVHRIGRTGRAGKTGIAISFVGSNDARALQQIERYIGQKIQKEVIEGLEPSKQSGKSSSGGKPFKGGKSFSNAGRGDRGGRPFAGGGRSDRDSRSSGGRGDRPSRPFADRGDRDSRPSSSRGDRPARSFSDRGERDSRPSSSRGDRPARSFSDRGDRDSRPSSSRGERPVRSFSDRGDRDSRPSSSRGERPARSFSSDRGDRPARPFADRGDKPRSFADKGDRGSRFSGSREDRPARSFSDKGDRGSRFSGSREDRPARSFSDEGDRGSRPSGDRVARSFADRGDKPRSFADKGDRGSRPSSSRGDKPAPRAFVGKGGKDARSSGGRGKETRY